MKKLSYYILSVFVAVVFFVSAIAFPESVKYTVDSAEATETTSYTAEDIRSLQKFLLSKETPDLSGKDYDLNNDDIWDIFDLCLMKKFSSESNILIAYFTRAENVLIENPEEIDTDATSSASLLLPGNSAVMANHIQSIVGGDLFSIVAENLYPADYENCLRRVSEEQAENIRPSLVNHIDNIDNYDIIFLGYPNWAYTCPMPVFSFLEEYDFSGKIIVPFCTHGTGGLAGTVSDIKKILPEDCKVMKPVGISREDISDCKGDIEKWLLELGFYRK
ncbi:MAG: hypothetical protein K2J39_07505 [Ruminococcus sp.]|nr:hypothetical protein [Ruminococcus sp.]